MKHNWKTTLTGIAGIALVCLVAQGCGQGGANEDANVIYKPSKIEKPSEVATGNGGGGQTQATGDDPKTPVVGGGVGTFKGKVVFDGSVPKLDPLYAKGAAVKNAEVCSAEPAPNQKLVVGEGNGVANVFVYLEKSPSGAKFKLSDDPVYFNQKNCVFFPHCVLLQTSQTLMVMSEDSIAHNTHTYPVRSTGESKQIPAPAPKDKAIPFKFPRSEKKPFEVKCDYHTWMIAYHLPLDHPFAAVTDKDGNFEIPNLPAGTHKFQVWHESADGGYIEKNLSVTIEGDGKTTTQDIKYPQGKITLAGRPATKTIKLSALTGE